jgi:hypothetical protein
VTAPYRPNGPAPYDVLTSRQALLEAAKLNDRALACIEAADDMADQSEAKIADDIRADAGRFAQVAQSLATYALAVDRWSP